MSNAAENWSNIKKAWIFVDKNKEMLGLHAWATECMMFQFNKTKNLGEDSGER